MRKAKLDRSITLPPAQIEPTYAPDGLTEQDIDALIAETATEVKPGRRRPGWFVDGRDRNPAFAPHNAADLPGSGRELAGRRHDRARQDVGRADSHGWTRHRRRRPGRGGVMATPLTCTADRDAAAARLAAADAESFRSEGPRIDGRIGTLLSLVLGALASSGAVGGIGASVSRQRHAYVAFGLLAVSAVVIVVGLVLIVRLILPRLTRVTPASGALAQVAALPDAVAARMHYQTAARNCLAYQSMLAYRHAVAITRRFYRFRTAGRVLVSGVVLASAGFLALGWGW